MATSTRGKLKATRPSASNKATSVSSKEGTMPLDWAVTAPTRTGTPKASEARISSCGRKSPIRGTINQ